MEKKLKNRALSYVDGVLTSHCILCGRYNGNEYDSNYFSLIRKKYCTKCLAEQQKKGLAFRKNEYKKNKKKKIKEFRSWIDEQRIVIQKQDEYIKMLQRQIDDLERSNQR
jgi:hypothetical protein